MALNVADVFSDPRFKNWLKVHIGLDSVRNALRITTEETIRTFHDGMLNKSLCGSCCNDNLTRTKKKDGWHLPCEICNDWMIAIRRLESKGFRCIWKNTEIARWKTHFWEIAKVFMNIQNKNDTSTGPDMDDCMKLLQLCMNCNLFKKTQQEKDDIKEVIKIRCELMHPTSLKLEDDAAENHLDSMITLMSAKFLKKRYAADALEKLKELRYDKSFDFDPAGGDAQPLETLISMEDNGSIIEQYENNIRHMRGIVEKGRRGVEQLNQSVHELESLLRQVDIGGKEGHAKSPQDPGRASRAGASDFKGATPERRSMGAAGNTDEAQLLHIVEAAGDGAQDPGQASGAVQGKSTGAIPKRRSMGAAGDPAADHVETPQRKDGYVAQLDAEYKKMNDTQPDRRQDMGYKYKIEDKLNRSKIEYVRDIVGKWRFRTPEGEEHKTEASAQKALARRILTNFYSEKYRDCDLNKCRNHLKTEYNRICRDNTPLDYKGKKIGKNWVVALTCEFEVKGEGATKVSTAKENTAKLCLEKLEVFL